MLASSCANYSGQLTSHFVVLPNYLFFQGADIVGVVS